MNIARQQWGRSLYRSFPPLYGKCIKTYLFFFLIYYIEKKCFLLYFWKKIIFDIWRKITDSITWFGIEASPWPLCHIIVHLLAVNHLEKDPRELSETRYQTPERVLGRFHLFRHCSGFLAPSIIMGEWEISPYSLLNIGMREGKSQCFSHTMTFMLITQGNTQRSFITQSTPFLRTHSLSFQANFRVLTSDPQGNSNFEHPISILTWLFLCMSHVFLYFTISCAWFGREGFLP